jgi:hypothetical protein
VRQCSLQASHIIGLPNHLSKFATWRTSNHLGLSFHFFPLSIPHLQATNISLYGASTVAYLQVSIPHIICCTAVNGSHPQARSPHPRRFSTCLPDRSRLFCLVKASRSRHLSIAAGGSLLHMLLAAGLSIAAQLRMPYRAAGQSHVTIHGTSNLEIDEPFTSMVK